MRRPPHSLACLAVLVLSLVRVGVGELFTSTAGLEQLLATEITVAQVLQEYISIEEHRLDELRRILARSRPEEDGDGQSFNPIDAFVSVKRMAGVIEELRMVIEEDVAGELIDALYNSSVVPTIDDMSGASVALLRLQDTYQLDTDDMSDGRIAKQAQKAQALTAEDCFQLAFAAYDNGWMHQALPWLMITHERMHKETQRHLVDLRTFNESVVLDYLAYTAHEQGNVEWALYYSRRLNEIDGGYPTAAHMELYERAVAESGSQWDGSYERLPSVQLQRNLDDVYPDFEALCRGENGAAPSDARCYLKRDTAFLSIAPIKVEKLLNDPEVFVFRGVVSQREVDLLRHMAEPALQRALVVNDEKGAEDGDDEPDDMAVSYRIAKNMWIEDADSELAAQISRRVSDMVDMDMESAEGLQIANYGLGGHYEPHYDMATDERPALTVNDSNIGNRIATVLFYGFDKNCHDSSTGGLHGISKRTVRLRRSHNCQ